MPDVQFSEEENYRASLRNSSQGSSKGALYKLVIRLGLAKDETGATVILVGVLVLIILLTIGVLIFV